VVQVCAEVLQEDERQPTCLPPAPVGETNTARLDEPRGDGQCRIGVHRVLSLLRELSVATCIYRQYTRRQHALHEKVTPCRPAVSVRGVRPSALTRFPPASATAGVPGPAPTPGVPRATWPPRRRSGGPTSRGGPRRDGRRPSRRRSGGGGSG